jgi:FG-GAP-like repeat
LQVADFNGDGNQDVLGYIASPSNTNNSLGLILGNGDGTFGAPLSITNAGFPFVADFNGDNKLDILEVSANQLVFLFNTGAAVTPDFSVGSGSGGGTATVTAGSTATYPLSLAGSGGFTGTVALTCSVAPAGPVCSVSPSSVMVSGSTAATATVSVTTTARSGLVPIGGSNERDPSRRILWIFGALLAAAGVIRLFAGTQARPRRFSWSLATACGAVLLLSASLISGCGTGSSSATGSGGSTATGTSAGNYNVTVTAQSGAVSHKTQLTLTVQ